MEQVRAEFRFQVADAQAHGGGRDAELGRCPREVSVAHAGLDEPQRFKRWQSLRHASS
jgi:hypothetical protein